MDTREQAWAAMMRAGHEGDTAAYERLLAEVADQLRRLMRARLSRLRLAPAEAEDIVQEVLIGVHTKRHTWDATRPFLPWLNAIAHYKLVDAARRLRRDGLRCIAIAPEAWDALTASDPIDPDRAVENVQRHIDRLPAGQAAVLRALAVEGVSVQATAARLETTEGVVRMTLHRALARIAATVEGGAVRPRGGTA